MGRPRCDPFDAAAIIAAIGKGETTPLRAYQDYAATAARPYARSTFSKSDGSGAVFLMNVTDPAEAHALLEKLPLGQADMMTFELIPMGPLWPLGLLLREPAK